MTPAPDPAQDPSALAARVAELEDALRARDSDASFGRTVRKGAGAGKLLAAAIASLLGVAAAGYSWVDARTADAAQDAVRDQMPAIRGEMSTIAENRTRGLAPQVDVAVQGAEIRGIKETVSKMDRKLDALLERVPPRRRP